MIRYTGILILVLVLGISCESPLEELNLPQEENVIDSFSSLELLTLNLDPHSEFHDKLQWVSFITAKVLYEEPAVRRDFIDAISPGTIRYVDFNTIMAPGTLFRTKFIDRLNLYVNPILTHHEISIPPFAPWNDVSSIINNLLNDNCLELYLPVQMDFSNVGIDGITSSAHPLTNAHVSTGIKRFYNPFLQITNTTHVSINASFLIGRKNVIIAQPVRNNNCTYTEINVSDFRDFLND